MDVGYAIKSSSYRGHVVARIVHKEDKNIAASIPLPEAATKESGASGGTGALGIMSTTGGVGGVGASGAIDALNTGGVRGSAGATVATHYNTAALKWGKRELGRELSIPTPVRWVFESCKTAPQKCSKNWSLSTKEERSSTRD